jgi:circadian clock protein KaiB
VCWWGWILDHDPSEAALHSDPGDENTTSEFDKALSRVSDDRYVLRLYLTGSTSRSHRALEAIKTLCERYLKGRYELEVVDLYQQPERADAAQIFALPTLVKELPLPVRRLVGDLTSPDRVLIALNLKPETEEGLIR